MKFENIRVYNFENALRGMRNPKESWHLSDSQYGLATQEQYNNIISDYTSKSWDQRNDQLNFEDFNDYCDKVEKDTCIYKNNGIVEYAIIGEKDLKLAQRLIRAGSEHRKFLRQIFITVDITAPLFYWKEFDTYKVGTVANSTSTMHKLTSKPITLDCFETDDYNKDLCVVSQDQSDVTEEGKKLGYISHWHMEQFVEKLINAYEDLRLQYLDTNNKKYWKELIRWLPEGWLQTRTVTMNYENILSMIHQRGHHKLNEWSGKDNDNLENFISFARTLPYSEELLFLDM